MFIREEARKSASSILQNPAKTSKLMKIAGKSFLAVLIAAGLLPFIPSIGEAFHLHPQFIAVLSGLGIEFLAEFLEDFWEDLKRKPPKGADEVLERLTAFFKAKMEESPEALREINCAIDKLGLIEAAKEAMRGKEEAYGPLLNSILSELLKFRQDFARSQSSVEEMLKRIEDRAERIEEGISCLTRIRPVEEIAKPPVKGARIPHPKHERIYGREIVVSELLSKLHDPKELRIISIEAGPGYGKTAVAIRLAREALDSQRFDDTLWVTAKLTEFIPDVRISIVQLRSKPLSWQEFMNELAAQLRCSPTQVQTRLREGRYLVVLDNAETSAWQEIIPRLNDMMEPSRALLTTRERFALWYVRRYPLPGLDAESSLCLLQEEAKNRNVTALARAPKKQLYEIHELTCGAPLALHFVVSRIAHDYEVKPVLEDLRQANLRVEDFYRFCFETAWQWLGSNSPNSIPVLRHMGHLADRSVSKDELAGVWEMSESDLNGALAALEKWHLIEVTLGNGGQIRYDLHPWVRACIRSGLVDKWQPSKEDVRRVIRWRIEEVRSWHES